MRLTCCFWFHAFLPFCTRINNAVNKFWKIKHFAIIFHRLLIFFEGIKKDDYFIKKWIFISSAAAGSFFGLPLKLIIIITNKAYRLFSFLLYTEELDSRKFLNSGFRWIYMFWDVLNTIWPFLENVCLYVLFCRHCISRTNRQKLMKLNISSCTFMGLRAD